MRVIVCGGRNYSDRMHLEECLDQLHASKSFTLLIAGGASGADSFAESWAKKRGVPCEVFAADWKRHGRAAGPIRNRRMLDEGKADMVVAFPGGRGTANMIAQARGRAVVIEISPKVEEKEP